MALSKLHLPPHQAQFATQTIGPRSVSFESPRSYFSGDKQRLLFAVNVGWYIDNPPYTYLRSFGRTTIANWQLPFLIDLTLEGYALATYVAQFQPGSWTFGALDGLFASINATLDVRVQ